MLSEFKTPEVEAIIMTALQASLYRVSGIFTQFWKTLFQASCRNTFLPLIQTCFIQNSISTDETGLMIFSTEQKKKKKKVNLYKCVAWWRGIIGTVSYYIREWAETSQCNFNTLMKWENAPVKLPSFASKTMLNIYQNGRTHLYGLWRSVGLTLWARSLGKATLMLFLLRSQDLGRTRCKRVRVEPATAFLRVSSVSSSKVVSTNMPTSLLM